MDLFDLQILQYKFSDVILLPHKKLKIEENPISIQNFYKETST